MPVAPTGLLSSPLDAVRTAHQGSAAFQSWIGAAIAPASRIAFIDGDDSIGEKYVVVDFGFDCSLEASDIADPSGFQPTLTVLVAYRWIIPRGTSDEDAALTFLNALGAILPEVQLALQRARVRLQAIRLVGGPERPDHEDRKHRDLYEAVFQFEAKDWPT